MYDCRENITESLWFYLLGHSPNNYYNLSIQREKIGCSNLNQALKSSTPLNMVKNSTS